MQTKTMLAPVQDGQLSALWVYDVLMKEIEPELMSNTIHTVDELHKDETPEERAERYERYEMAFELFNECLQDINYDWKTWALDGQQELKMKAAEEGMKEEKNAMSNIEQELDDSDFRA